MKLRDPRIWRNFTVTSAALALTALSVQSLSAATNPPATYLALGDSVAYGLNVTLLTQTPPPTPSAFVGYPEVLSTVPGMSNRVIDTSCPGESSASFYIDGAPDYGCHDAGPQGQPPFKSWIGLHTNYPGTQLSFAVSELQSNKHINLVTLGIGANDILLLLRQCGTDQTCIGTQLPLTLAAYGKNLAAILTAIRQTGYTGKLVLVLQYSPQAALTPFAAALNGVMLTVGPAFGATFADGFTAFTLASLPYGGDPCAAGLLVNLGGGQGCDIHPSLKGQEILAATVLFATGGKL